MQSNMLININKSEHYHGDVLFMGENMIKPK